MWRLETGEEGGGGLGHSRCLESLYGDFLYIAVLVIGAAVRLYNQNLRRYVCTTSTCNGLVYK